MSLITTVSVAPAFLKQTQGISSNYCRFAAGAVKEGGLQIMLTLPMATYAVYQ